MNEYSIQLYSGGNFDFSNPSVDDFSIHDIAHGLSNTCRYAGQCKAFYSVAQHSILVSRLVPGHLALHGLLHDAQEAFMCDMPAPLKRLLPDYRRIENEIEEIIISKFGLSRLGFVQIKKADMIALATEKRDLMLDKGEWEMLRGIDPDEKKIIPMTPTVAKWFFMKRYGELNE